MSGFTQEGIKRVIAGEFAGGTVTGRLGLQLMSMSGDQITVKYFIAALNENEILYEYDEVPMEVGQQVMLDGAEVTTPFEVTQE